MSALKPTSTAKSAHAHALPPTAPASSASTAAVTQSSHSATTTTTTAARSVWTKTFDNGDSYSGEALHVHGADKKPIKDGQGRYTWISSGAVYEGEWRAGQPHGHGVMTVPGVDGYEYTGTYQEGKRSGRGRCQFSNGRLYDGKWLADEMNGHGTLRGAPGADDYAEYVGPFEQGKRNGPNGRCTYLNGDVYEGPWLAGRRQGFGEWRLHRPTSAASAAAPVRYRGPFDSDVPHATGPVQAEVKYTDGSTYVGAVDASLRRHGNGIHHLSNGDVYEGSFLQDQRDGRGTLQGSDGSRCEGSWRRGQLEGEIRVTLASDAAACTGAATLSSSYPLSDVREVLRLNQSAHVHQVPIRSYVGPCVAGVLTGVGAIILYADGSSYRGAVRHGVPHGAGVLRDRPLPYGAVGHESTAPSASSNRNTNSGTGTSPSSSMLLRRRIPVVCLPPSAELTLLRYEGNFATGEPDGTGDGEWQVAPPPSSSPRASSASSSSPSRVTPCTFECTLAEGNVRWWPGTSCAQHDGTYTGQWVRGLPQGQGRWQWRDGSRYSGGVFAFVPSGHGSYASDAMQYTGEFKEGQPDGAGEWVCATLGLTYEGEWSAGQPSGSGACALVQQENAISSSTHSALMLASGGAASTVSATSPCTRVYEGTWLDGKPSGHGRTYAFADRQRVVYDGAYVDGHREGQGTLYFGSARRASFSLEESALLSPRSAAMAQSYAQYKGMFHRGSPDGGPSCLVLRNGTTVEGAFDGELRPCLGATMTVTAGNEAWTFTGTLDASKRIGHGVMKFPNGDVYEGDVEDVSAESSPPGVPAAASSTPPPPPLLFNLQRHGRGVYRFVEGNQLTCTWRHNILHGTGVYTSADGAQTERVYADGVLTSDAMMGGSTADGAALRAASGGVASVGSGGVLGNVFTPENEYPNTISEEVLKVRLADEQQAAPAHPSQKPQPQSQTRPRQPFHFIRRGEARQASLVGPTGSTSPRRGDTGAATATVSGATAGGGRGENISLDKKLASTPPQQHRPAQPPSPSPSASSQKSDGQRQRACVAAAPAAHERNKYSLRRPKRNSVGGGGTSAHASTPAHAIASTSGSSATTTMTDKSVKPISTSINGLSGMSAGSQSAAAQTSPSVYVGRFQAGISKLDHMPASSTPQSAHASAAATPTSTGPANTKNVGPLRRRLSSALAAGRGTAATSPERQHGTPLKGSLQGSLKEMMQEACAIRSSREDEIHLLTEEMRQLNERIWQLRYTIAHDDGKADDNGADAGRATAITDVTSTSQPSSKQRRASLPKRSAGVSKATATAAKGKKAQRLATLIHERKVIMEKLQYVVNTPE